MTNLTLDLAKFLLIGFNATVANGLFFFHTCAGFVSPVTKIAEGEIGIAFPVAVITVLAM